MANVLVVSGSYFPNATANAVCMKQYENALIKEGHKVFYAVKRHDFDMEYMTKEDDVDVYHVGNTVEEFYRVCSKLQKNGLPHPLNFLFNFSLRTIKLVMKIYTKIFWKSQRRYSIEKYLDIYAKTIKEIVEKENIDVIISVSMPFLSNLAVLRYKEKYEKAKKTKWIWYMIDAYSKKYGVNENEKNKDEEEEIEIFDNVDYVLMLNVLENDYKCNPFDRYFYKTKIVYLPLFNLNNQNIDVDINDGILVESKKINCVFAGTLYDETSAVRALCDFIEQLNNELFVFHLLGKFYPKNLEMLNCVKQKTACKINIYGQMPYSYARASISKADILINIGNACTNQIPSKIFQYMTHLKPILSFYNNIDDTGLPYLKKYPLAYNIYEKDIKDNDTLIDDFMAFYNNIDSTTIDAGKLKKIFIGFTTDDVCEDFIHYFNKIIG